MSFRLVIDKDTFIWLRESKGLVYNTSNFKSFEFDVSDEIRKVCEHLNELSNLYEIVLDESYSLNILLKEWIANLLYIDSAQLLSSEEEYLPSLKPVLRIQHDLVKIAKDRNFTEATNCLKEITIHLTGADLLEEEKSYHKQFIYPTRLRDELDIDKLIILLNSVPQKSNIQLNFVGNYSSCLAISELLSTRINTISFYFRIEDVCNSQESFQFINQYKIYVYCKCTESLSMHVKSILQKIDHPHFLFLVASEDDYNAVASVNKEKIDYDLIPLYTGENQDFFEENIYVNKTDCIESRIDKRHIFMNQALNGNFFGKLEVLSDGTIWENLNFSKLGSIDDNFFELLLLTFNSNRAWFYNRKQEPCTKCLYQWLCPPPLNYELVIGCPNLCHIKDYSEAT